MTSNAPPYAVTAAAKREFDLADAAARARHLPAAARAFRALLEAHPNYPGAHGRLALVLLDLHRYAEANLHFRAALAAEPAVARHMVGLGYCLQRESDLAAAERWYQKALALVPGQIQAMLGLGTCARQQGQLEVASRWFERASEADSLCVDAYHLMVPLRRFSADDPVRLRCEGIQPRIAALPAIKQARYWFALGKMREDAAEYDAAFEAYTTGSRARASLFALDESDAEAWLQRTCAGFSAERLAGCQQPPAPSDHVPVFVVGMPRSGTSLIEQILDCHPQVRALGEIPDFGTVLTPRAGPPQNWPESVPALADSDLRALGAAYLERIFSRAPDVSHVINKTTVNYRHIGAIRMLLPQARIIHATRDPMDSCFSCFTHLFDGDNLPYTYDLGTLGRYYVRYAKLMRHWAGVLPGAVLDVRYEDLVGDTERQVRRMLAYLGLAWDARCLEFYRNRRVVETASQAQVTRPIYQSSVARWRHFESHLTPLLDLVAEYR